MESSTVKGIRFPMAQQDSLQDIQQAEPGFAAVPLASLGDLLIAARTERGITQQELAAFLDTQQEAVARMERERYRSVSLERLLRVSESLGLSLTIAKTESEPSIP